MVNMGELFAYPRIADLPMDLVPVSDKEHQFLLREGDLLFARQSLVLSGAGQCSIFVGNKRPTVFESHLIRCRVDQSRVNPHFYFYFFRSPEGRKAIEAIVEQGAGASGIRGSDLVNVAVPMPEKWMQDDIAGTLGSIDDRIALLRETNATLEAIAQALFKSWFVDFDPVRAKMAGRAPEGMDEATSGLFPDGIESSVLGEVPNGWRPTQLSAVCSYLNRGISPKYAETGGVLVLNQKCIRDFTVDPSKGRRHDPALRKTDGRELNVGDVLVNSTGVGTLGRVAQVLSLPETSIVDSHVTVVRAGSRISPQYLGQWMMRMQPTIEAMGEGSTGQTELSRSKLGDLMVLVPPPSVLDAFDVVLKPLQERIACNAIQSQTLSVFRDTLLPRLISGQLRLPEAEPQSLAPA
jgi:type I restriction enzyme S subunit